MNKVEFQKLILPYLGTVRDNFINTFYKSVSENLSNSDKTYVYFDMDGTLAKWHKDGKGLSYPEQILDPRNHYYRDLEPNEWVIELAKEVSEFTKTSGINMELGVISAADIYCIEDKITWLNKYCPFIKDENIFFCPIGEDKTKYVRNPRESVLLDDYHINLKEWEYCGGKTIKVVTECNTYDAKRDCVVKENAGYSELYDSQNMKIVLKSLSNICSEKIKESKEKKNTCKEELCR